MTRVFADRIAEKKLQLAAAEVSLDESKSGVIPQADFITGPGADSFESSSVDQPPLRRFGPAQLVAAAGTKVEDISVLRSFPLLRVVSLSETEVKDITALSELEKLENVVLRDCKKLVVEQGNETYNTVKAMIDRGVDVYLPDPLIEQYKQAAGT